MKKTVSMKEGPIFSQMLVYILPLIASNLLQVMYTVADNVIVSLSNEPDAVGAIGTTVVFIGFLTNLCIGFSVGIKVVIARYIGQKDTDSVSSVLHTAVLLSLVMSLVLSVAGILSCRPVLSAMGNRGKLLELATEYTKIYFSGVVFIAMTNCFMAAIQAKGDTKTPMLILMLSGLMNVLFNLFFVLWCGMSVDGVAVATVISNAISAALMLRYLMKGTDLSRKKFKIPKRVILAHAKEILSMGVPAGIQNALFSISHMLTQSSIVTVNNITVSTASAFQPVVKGCAACASLEGFSNAVISAIGQGTIPFISQNVGANNNQRVASVRRAGYLIVLVLSAAVSGALLLFRNPLLKLYGISGTSADSLEQLAYTSAIIRMTYMFIPQFILGLMEVGGAVMQGLGKALTASVTSLSGSCVFRIIWLMTSFRANPSLEMIFISFPVTWIITACAHWCFGAKEIQNRLR